MSSNYYRDRLGFEPEKDMMASSTAASRTSRTVASYSSSSLSRQEVTGMQYQQTSSRSHYASSAVSSQMGNGAVDLNGGGHGGHGGHGTHGQYEQNLEKFKGKH